MLSQLCTDSPEKHGPGPSGHSMNSWWWQRGQGVIAQIGMLVGLPEYQGLNINHHPVPTPIIRMCLFLNSADWKLSIILLMEETLWKKWEILHINWCRISSINSSASECLHLPKDQESFGMLILGLINCVLGPQSCFRAVLEPIKKNLGSMEFKARTCEHILQNPKPKGVPDNFGTFKTQKSYRCGFWSSELLNKKVLISIFHHITQRPQTQDIIFLPWVLDPQSIEFADHDSFLGVLGHCPVSVGKTDCRCLLVEKTRQGSPSECSSVFFRSPEAFDRNLSFSWKGRDA